MKYGPLPSESFENAGSGVLISCEGNFMYGNASLSFFNPSTGAVENDVFTRVNAIALGDVAQSVTMHGATAYVVVNNSGVVFAFDPSSFKVKGAVTGFVSPRYLCPINDSTAYVSDLYAAAISIVDLKTMSIVGKIPTPGHPSTEQLIYHQGRVWVNTWSYDNTLLVIDALSHKIVDSVKVGLQPKSMAMDKNGALWVLTDGGYSPSLQGYGPPTLYKIATEDVAVESAWPMDLSQGAVQLALNGQRDTLYVLNKHLWRMPIESRTLPETPFMQLDTLLCYSMGVDPRSSEFYLADAIDYVQPGIVYRYSPQGVVKQWFKVGIIPGFFAFQ